ncbi:MAG TPA: 2-phospho-L-lactate transferase CofD family protein [Nakamurella sp.]|nr:2-phospho-L-lactate transferase CofD family protein [Nakamurella sp.]
MRIAVLAGGVGGAKFLLGVKAFLGWQLFGPAPEGAADTVTAVVNTGDDIRLHNLQVCPDLDSCLYTLSGASDPERGWGRAGESWTVSAELAAYGAEAPWFSLGDKDIATHLVRTRMLDAGYPLSDVTAALSQRWQPGVTLLPMTDDRVETHVVVADPEAAPPTSGSVAGPGNPGPGNPGAGDTGPGDTGPGDTGPGGDEPAADAVGGDGEPGRPSDGDATSEDGPALVALHFQEWWIRYRAALPAISITPIGADTATPAPGVLPALSGADVIVIAPSNPVVSIGTILAVPGIAETLRAVAAPVVGVSPIIGGSPVRGHADACLAAIGVECSAQGVAGLYGARSTGGLLDAFLVADGDTAAVPGLAVGSAPLLMTDPAATAAMVGRALRLVGLPVAGRSGAGHDR